MEALRQKWDLYLAIVLVYAAIGTNLGPGIFFLAAFTGGCFAVIATALRRS
jgi:hypothetical protein